MKLFSVASRMLLTSASLSIGLLGCQKDAPATPANGAPTTTGAEAAKPAEVQANAAEAAPTAVAPTASPEGLVKEAPADVAAAPADAQKTASGLAYKVLKSGTGDVKPGPSDTVRVHYAGWTTDGKLFDSQLPPGQGISFPLNQVIKGWTEGLQLMRVGDRFRFWIPTELAYNNMPGRPQGVLVFDVELLEVKGAPKAPADVAAAPADAQKTSTGLAYKELAPGKSDKKPSENAVVTVHYTGWTTDGNSFDSSHVRGEPASFPLKGVIPGWTEGLQHMTEGSKMRFWIPEELAYKGMNGAPQGMLVFDVELLSFVEPPPPPTTPPDVAGPPADAQKTESGLAWKVLSPGNGSGQKPTADSTVTVHYSGWTTDGQMFDSSVTRGTPASFPLKGVIKGWTEGLQLMEVGSKARLWIPEALAYQGRPGAPAGMLVFDVELLSIR